MPQEAPCPHHPLSCSPAAHLNRSGDTLTVELIQPDSMPAVVRIVWPAKPSVTAPTPKALAALAAAMVRTSGGGADRTRREGQEQPMNPGRHRQRTEPAPAGSYPWGDVVR